MPVPGRRVSRSTCPRRPTRRRATGPSARQDANGRGTSCQPAHGHAGPRPAARGPPRCSSKATAGAGKAQFQGVCEATFALLTGLNAHRGRREGTRGAPWVLLVRGGIGRASARRVDHDRARPWRKYRRAVGRTKAASNGLLAAVHGASRGARDGCLVQRDGTRGRPPPVGCAPGAPSGANHRPGTRVWCRRFAFIVSSIGQVDER